MSALCLTVVVLLSLLALPAAAADGQTVHWSGTFSSVDNNTIATADLPADPNRVEQVWSSEVGNNTIVILDDKIYTYNGVNPEMWGAYSDGGTFYEIDAQTGNVLRSVPCDYGTRFYYSYSIYANGLIYVGCPTVIMAFDPETCSMVWDTPVTERYYSTVQYVGGCIVSNGTVLQADTGEVLATVSGPKWSSGWSNGVEKNGKYYVADATESLYEIDTDTWTVTASVSSGLEAATSCPGVMFYDGSLYWGGSSGQVHQVRLSQTGISGSMTSVQADVKCYGAPVAYQGRIYFAGMTANSSSANVGRILVSVHDAETLSTIYQTQNTIDGKIQSTPILSATASGTVRIYVQGYKKPGTVYYLEDNASKTSGELTLLVEPDQSNYAWSQLACDQNGAIYCSNDNGFLMKYQTRKQTAAFRGGDVNGDGKVKMTDAVFLSRYLAHWQVTIHEDQADTNGDGRISMADSVLLRRYLAGWFHDSEDHNQE